MIIERKYVPLGILCEKDEKANEIYNRAFEYSDLEQEEIERIIEYNKLECLYDRDIGCGIPNFAEIKEEFEKLDEVDPFDNDLTYEDVREIEILYKDEFGIHYLLKDSFGRIVQSVEMKNSFIEYIRVWGGAALDIRSKIDIEIKVENNIVYFKSFYKRNWDCLNKKESYYWLEDMESIKFQDWKEEYDSGDLDGYSYTVIYKAVDKEKRKFRMHNSYPRQWRGFINLIKTLSKNKRAFDDDFFEFE